MPVFADGRIPVLPVADEAAMRAALAARPGAAVLAEAPPPEMPAGAVAVASFDLYLSSHPQACTCCGGRPPLAAALDRLFLARVKGQAPWFDRVVALVPGEDARAALARTLKEDPMASSRYRPEAPGGRPGSVC
ncbi:hypothetical protein EAH89_24625 [Roseomonas nepalensis]|uniref:Uncharacterized protein n=1 Tax=Muricoccus nepalensis TaxID=1854500 RepID=A0A502FAU6_9PROT|nr:hypothetical protein [Roseomonas nepalensis]TPG46500.1 hypothetical protein EAH89_24625 [Roseomonas nepalensis]